MTHPGSTVPSQQAVQPSVPHDSHGQLVTAATELFGMLLKQHVLLLTSIDKDHYI